MSEPRPRRPHALADFSGIEFEIGLSAFQWNSPLNSCGSTTGESQWLGTPHPGFDIPRRLLHVYRANILNLLWIKTACRLKGHIEAQPIGGHTD